MREMLEQCLDLIAENASQLVKNIFLCQLDVTNPVIVVDKKCAQNSAEPQEYAQGILLDQMHRLC